jgi:Fe-Mn family superoxide dismutase
MDFGAKAATYVDTFMDVIRWNNAERIFVQMASGQGAGGGTG